MCAADAVHKSGPFHDTSAIALFRGERVEVGVGVVAVHYHQLRPACWCGNSLGCRRFFLHCRCGLAPAHLYPAVGGILQRLPCRGDGADVLQDNVANLCVCYHEVLGTAGQLVAVATVHQEIYRGKAVKLAVIDRFAAYSHAKQLSVCNLHLNARNAERTGRHLLEYFSQLASGHAQPGCIVAERKHAHHIVEQHIALGQIAAYASKIADCQIHVPARNAFCSSL